MFVTYILQVDTARDFFSNQPEASLAGFSNQLKAGLAEF